MTDVLDPASMIEAAQEAASAGDFSTAERLLRDAAGIQEAILGSLHPELATTLNNLAFVCERTNNIAEAERGYRRAHAIAVATLSPRDPFVATSVKNLVDFCAAHEIPIWTPPSARSGNAVASRKPAAEAHPEVTQPEAEAIKVHTLAIDNSLQADFASEDRQEPVPVTAGARWPASRTIAVAALGVVVIAAVLFTMRSPKTASPSVSPPPSSTTPAPAVTRAAEPTLQADSGSVAVEAKPPDATPPARTERPEPRNTRVRSVTPQPVTVLNAQLCRRLEKRGSPDWQCASANGDLRPGTYIFYTRLLTNANTTVEHRWYRDGRVHQVMRLRVSANPNGGYRTFSSNTISRERAGDWKVELRASDGTVLQQEQFVIR